MAAADNTEKRAVIETFVRALGGGRGSYDGAAHAKTFQQDESHSFGDKQAMSPQQGLGFGRIKFPDNDQSAPYIRIPWRKDDKYNILRAQVSKAL
jgi:hypothetical protein